MSALPAYLQKAREATGRHLRDTQTRSPVTAAECEKSERSEKSTPPLQPGRRYQVRGPLVGVIHADPPGLAEWRKEANLPRAGVMTIAGQTVLVADVTATVRTGWADVIGVSPGLGGGLP